MKNILVAVIAISILVFAAGCKCPCSSNTDYQQSKKYPGYPTYAEVTKVHGHTCPGSMMGYRMAIAGMNAAKAAGMEPKEMCAIVENNACGVDALQVVTGCTFGKKKIIFHDFGKSVYTLFSLKTKKGFRVTLHMTKMPENVRKDREAFTNYLLEAPEEDILTVKEVKVDIEMPKHTRESIVCDLCKERVNKNRVVVVENMKICIPCSK